MQVKRTHTFAAGADDVVAMLTDTVAVAAKYEGMGHRDIAVLGAEHGEESASVRTSRVVDVDLPGFAKRVLKPTNTLVQSDEWHRGSDGGWEGTFDVEVQGAPIHMAGTMRLTPDGEGCTEEVVVDVTASIPLIGGRIADWAGKGDVTRSVEAEYDFGDRWLAEHRS